uniref:uracil-DNA glycosylase n=1 Tax=Flavobacterium sp. TaxID=239 RepID=UPI0040499D0F
MQHSFIDHLHPAWQTLMKDEFQKDEFQKLQTFVASAYQNTTCFPPKDLIFNAFNHCLPSDVKVVIIGQDPYHGFGQANGLCFSVQEGIPIPPSLKNIFIEIKNDLGKEIPTSGDLSHWPKQGVLMLNATLTVESGKAGSHQKKGWELFTDAVIRKINNCNQPIVYLLWGGFAQNKSKLMTNAQHQVLQSGHPSPLSANRGLWFGNQHFSQTNNWLESKNLTTINW